MPFVESKGNFCFRAHITELKIFNKEYFGNNSYIPSPYDLGYTTSSIGRIPTPESLYSHYLLLIIYINLSNKSKVNYLIFLAKTSITKNRILSRQKVEAQFKPANPKSLHNICILLILLTVSSAILTLFSKSFSSFPHGTCLLSVSCQYLALDECLPPN